MDAPRLARLTSLASVLALIAACSGDRVPIRVALAVSSDQLADFAAVKSIRLTLSGGGTTAPRSVTVSVAERISTALLEPVASRFDLALVGLDSDGAEIFRGSRRNVVPPATLDLPMRRPNDFARALSPMRAARQHATATALSDGRVLIAGGRAPSGEALSSAEIFEPDTATLRDTGAMNRAREHHGAALLSDGRVLIAGGAAGSAFVLDLEIYDPRSGTFELAGQLTSERAQPSVTVYRQGATEKVLIAGGRGASGPVASCDVYLPSTRSTAPPRSLLNRRAGHAAVSLGETILIVGGSATELRGEIFRASDEGVTLTSGAMAVARALAFAARTDAGRVLIAGTSDTVEEYLASSGLFQPVTTLPNTGVAGLAAIPGDRALVMTGAAQPQTAAFVVTQGTPAPLALDLARTAPTLLGVPDGTALVVGGSGENTAEVFLPAAP